MRRKSRGLIAVGILAWPGFAYTQSWTAVTSLPAVVTAPCYAGYGAGFPAPAPNNVDAQVPIQADYPALLTDGSVVIQNAACQDFYRLTPDNHGNYANGSWTEVASLPGNYAPLDRAGAVLPDGRYIIEGGEYNQNEPVDTGLGAIYDPVKNVWTAVQPPSFFTNDYYFLPNTPIPIGDAASVVLPNGTFMLANCCGNEAALLNTKTLTWTQTGTGKADGNYDEEGFTLLPNGKVLTVDTNNTSNLTNSELYNPATGMWTGAGSTIVKLDDLNADGTGSHEMGPQVLRPDGTVIAFGATGFTSIYNSRTGTWTPGPSFPDVTGEGQLDVADGAAALLPSGNVLVVASPGLFNPPSHFYEFDGANLNPAPNPLPDTTTNGTGWPNTSYPFSMLVLPSGQILVTDRSNTVQLYTPAGEPNDNWRPVIGVSPLLVVPGKSYEIFGWRFNGMSQGGMYGDDYQGATNFPLVRITNIKTGHVFYSRTHDHSSMAVASNAFVSTHFDVPVGQEAGLSKLEVVADGIASNPWIIDVR
jgi:hypothetical protein